MSQPQLDSRPSWPPPGLTRGQREPVRVALLGNPNTGKTTLFNRLCGLRAKTANFPGTTTEARIGRAGLGAPERPPAEVIDLPGAYRLNLELPESRVCRDVLHGAGLYRQPDAAVVVVDATNLARNLRLVAELLAIGLPTVVALNMVDLAQHRGLTIDPGRLAAQLGCPVVPLIARRGVGVEALRETLGRLVTGDSTAAAATAPLPDPGDLPALDAWADAVVAESVGGEAAVGSGADSLTERLDQAFTHPVLGVAVFVAVMSTLFWAIFSLASVPMDLIEASFKHLGGWLGATLPPGAVRELLVQGVVGGIAGTVVFLPQIWLLFFLISLLEDTGYLVRAAFVMDRILCRFGLPGQAFVPLLSSHACAIPGILSSRLIPDRRDRLATILVAPFMSCSARLPVYVLLTGLLFRHRPLLGGAAFAGCYLLGAGAALGSAFVARRTVLRGRSRPMVLELPSYKLPSLRTALFVALDQGKTFLRKAGTVILGICMLMWWLSAYPHAAPPAAATALRQQAAAAAATAPDEAAALTARADFLEQRNAEAQSFAGRLGRTLQPLFAPLGYDWQLTVGVLTSFVAREVFVSTMAVLLVGNGDADVEDQGVIDRIAAARRDDGTAVFSTATAASLLVFFVLAMQCLPTLAVTRRETGGLRWAGLQLAWMSGLAYTAAWLTYHGLRWWGVA
jgi:ferrous iron transport protein B